MGKFLIFFVFYGLQGFLCKLWGCFLENQVFLILEVFWRWKRRSSSVQLVASAALRASTNASKLNSPNDKFFFLGYSTGFTA